MLAPPIIVFINDACPGQSTNVNYKYWYASRAWECCSLNQSGISMIKAENPRSNVIPLSFDYGFLSNPAVEAMVLMALHKLVLPESMWPNTPILIFNICYGFKVVLLLSILTMAGRSWTRDTSIGFCFGCVDSILIENS